MLTFEDSTTPVRRKLKILVYGAPKVGKTWFALHAPAPLVIDTESSTDAYRGQPDMPGFKVAKSASPREIIPVLEQLQAAGSIRAGGSVITPETLVIDSFSVLWQVRQEAGQKMAEDRAIKYKKNPDEAKVAFGDWSVIKKPIQRIYTQLINLPVHVIITARQKDLYDDDSTQPKVIGQAPDIERNAPYIFDLILRLAVENGKRIGIVEGSRFADFPPGKRIENPSWETFAHLASVEGAESTIPDMDAAAEAEAKPEPAAWTRDEQRLLGAREMLGKLALSESDANKALGIEDWTQTHLDPVAFKHALEAYVEAQMDAAEAAEAELTETVQS